MKLKKRFLILTLCFCAAFAMTCVSASAEGETHSNHCICGGSVTTGGHTTHDESVTWTKWESAIALPSEAGNYYLKQNVTLTSTWTVNNDINLCLNGKTITGASGKDVIEVSSGKKLTITDCTSDSSKVGKITHVSTEKGRGILNKGTLNLWNGNITGNTIAGEGGGVRNGGYNYNESANYMAIFNMYGGSISGNETNGSSNGNNGGGVHVYSDSTFNMYDGSIDNNTAGTHGGGVFINGTFNMSGGSIKGNKTGSNSYDGGGVNNNNIFKMTGGTISGNSATGDGGGVSNSKTFTMSGGTISGNSANSGGGVYNGFVYNGNNTFDMSGGTISGNSANNSGGGVYNYGTLNLSGSVKISGNVVGGTISDGTLSGGTKNNVYLYNSKTITVGEASMNAGASVGITAQSPTTNPTVVSGTTSTTGFTSDNDDYWLTTNGSGGLKLTNTVTISGVKLLNATGGADMTMTNEVGSKVYDGKTVAYSGGTTDAPTTVTDVTLTYTWQKKATDGDTYSNLTAVPKDAGSYRLHVEAKRGTGTASIGEANYDFTITKAPGSGSVTMDGWTYGGTAKSPEPTSTTNIGTVTYKYKVKSATDYLSGVPTNAGEYTVEATFAATNNYNEVVVTKDFTISPKTLSDPAITVGSCTYDGTEQKPPITVKDGDTTIDESEYNVVYSDNINAGTATVKITDEEGGNYTVNGSANFSILKAAPQARDFTFTPPTNLTYDGTAKTATVTANSGITGEVTVSYYNSVGEKLEAAPSSVGTYNVKINVAEGGNYNAVNDITDDNWKFTINKASASSGGGGGGHSSSYQEITLVEPKGGEVLVSPTSAKSGETVTVTLKPEEGYEADSVTVLDKDGKAIEVSKKGDGAYTFTMPAGKASVSATFKKTSDKGKSYADCPKDATCPIDKFTDAKNTAWYHDGVHYCLDESLMKGMSDVEFWPNGDVTRAQIVTILWRIEGSKVVNYAMKFKDVEDGSWYAEAIRWAASEDVVTGYSDEAFGPNDSVTREQLATILYRYAKYKGMDVTGKVAELDKFSDGASVSAYALPAMKWAVGSQIINGTTTTTLSPKGTATRAQAASLMQRFLTENK